MRHVARIVLPNHEPDSVEQMWSRRRKLFVGLDGRARIQSLGDYYRANDARIHEALQTGTPMFDLVKSGVPPRPAPRSIRRDELGLAEVVAAVIPSTPAQASDVGKTERTYRFRVPQGGVILDGHELLAGAAETQTEEVARKLLRAGAELTAVLEASVKDHRVEWREVESTARDFAVDDKH